MGKGKGKNKPHKAPQRGPDRPLSRLPESSRRFPHTDTALTTYELLEAILLHVDERTLLVSAQRVSTVWRRTITTSPPLQRRLFFLPPLRNDTTSSNPAPLLAPNPLLQLAFPCLFPPRQTTPNPDSRPKNLVTTLLPASRFRPAYYNPPLPARPPKALFNSYGLGKHAYYPPLLDVRRRRGVHLACARAGASWRRMLLSSPPVCVVARAGTARDLRNGWREGLVVDLEGEGGLRMGEFYDAVFDLNWRDVVAEDGYFYRPRGGWMAWGLHAAAKEEREGEGEGEGEAGWLTRAELVIGEHDGDNVYASSSGCEWHLQGEFGRHCLSKASSDLDYKWIYQCEEYRASERLWLPRPETAFSRSYESDDPDVVEGLIEVQVGT